MKARRETTVGRNDVLQDSVNRPRRGRGYAIGRQDESYAARWQTGNRNASKAEFEVGGNGRGREYGLARSVKAERGQRTNTVHLNSRLQGHIELRTSFVNLIA